MSCQPWSALQKPTTHESQKNDLGTRVPTRPAPAEGQRSSSPPPALRERRHCSLTSRGIAVRRRAVFVMPKGQCPHPRCPDWRCVGFENSANHDAVSKHIEIVVVPLARWAACRCAFQEQVVFVHYRAALALLGPQQPQFFGLTLDFLNCAGATEETRYPLQSISRKPSCCVDRTDPFRTGACRRLCLEWVARSYPASEFDTSSFASMNKAMAVTLPKVLAGTGHSQIQNRPLAV